MPLLLAKPKHLLTEAASLDKIINVLSKDVKDNGLNQSDLADLIMTDPTSTTNARGQFVGKYWKWIYNQYKQGNIHLGDQPELEAALNTYNINKSQINRPIDSFNTLDELVEAIADYNDSFKATRTLSKGEQELEKVYEDQYVVVYIPHTWEAARKIGGDTRWCTASSSDHYFNHYINSYGGEYYDIIRKSDGAKFQLHPESKQFMDSNDNRVTFADIFTSKQEAAGLLGFFGENRKDIIKWLPKTWPEEVKIKLANGLELEEIFDGVTYIRGFGNLRKCYLGEKCFLIKMANNGYEIIGNKAFDEIYINDYNVTLPSVSLFDGKNMYIYTPNGLFNLLDNKIDLNYYGKTEHKNKYITCGKIGGFYVFYDGQGKLTIKKIFESVYDFNEGISSVCFHGKWGFVNEFGKLITDEWFDNSYSFYEREFTIVEKLDKWYVIDRNGKYVFDFKNGEFFSDIETEFGNRDSFTGVLHAHQKEYDCVVFPLKKKIYDSKTGSEIKLNVDESLEKVKGLMNKLNPLF